MITKSFPDGRLHGREGRGMGIASRMIVRWHGPANGAEPPQGIGPRGGAWSSHPVAGRKHPCESCTSASPAVCECAADLAGCRGA